DRGVDGRLAGFGSLGRGVDGRLARGGLAGGLCGNLGDRGLRRGFVRSGLGGGLGRVGRGRGGGALGRGGVLAFEEFPFPFGQGLLGSGLLLTRGLGGSRADQQTVGDRVGGHTGQQADTADRVVVARDRVVDLVR